MIENIEVKIEISIEEEELKKIMIIDNEIEEMNIKTEEIEEEDLLMMINLKLICRVIKILNIKVTIETWEVIHLLVITINNKQHLKEIKIKIE